MTIHTLRDPHPARYLRHAAAAPGLGIEIISKYLEHQDPALTMRRYWQAPTDELEQGTVDLRGGGQGCHPPPDEEAGMMAE